MRAGTTGWLLEEFSGRWETETTVENETALGTEP